MSLEHYEKVWGTTAQRHAPPPAPDNSMPSEFCVVQLARSVDTIAFGTCGMSAGLDDVRLELHMLVAAAPAATAVSIVELLTVTAHYHRTGRRLDIGHTVNFGRPWLPGSACDHALVSLPYLDGPALEWSKDGSTRFLWLLPLTASEVAFKRTYGLDALEARFEQAEFNYLDPLRDAVA
jgi:hypothetical protein